MRGVRALPVEQHKYYFCATDKKSIIIDARTFGNYTRFIQHSCKPNCALVPYTSKGVRHIVVKALRDGRTGELATVSYGWTDEEWNEECKCGAATCSGSIARLPGAKVEIDLTMDSPPSPGQGGPGPKRHRRARGEETDKDSPGSPALSLVSRVSSSLSPMDAGGQL
eukprot:615316-Rhodomonas_salina.1